MRARSTLAGAFACSLDMYVLAGHVVCSLAVLRAPELRSSGQLHAGCRHANLWEHDFVLDAGPSH